MTLIPLISGLLVAKAFAASPFSLYCSALGTYCGDGQAYLIHIAVRTADVIVIPVVGGIAVIAVLWASIKLVGSRGDDSGKEDAKKIIIGAIIGIVLAVTGVAIVHWMCGVVQLATGGNLPCG